jgi:hypothetical protein
MFQEQRQILRSADERFLTIKEAHRSEDDSPSEAMQALAEHIRSYEEQLPSMLLPLIHSYSSDYVAKTADDIDGESSQDEELLQSEGREKYIQEIRSQLESSKKRLENLFLGALREGESHKEALKSIISYRRMLTNHLNQLETSIREWEHEEQTGQVQPKAG